MILSVWSNLTACILTAQTAASFQRIYTIVSDSVDVGGFSPAAAGNIVENAPMIIQQSSSVENRCH